ncbi:MAG: hypothetical protein LBN97_03360 [Oscillospiraceae bacterium]|jgi:hypothetical protein|nr:hypothetical protein [Oscillospiraceae bacterium]
MKNQLFLSQKRNLPQELAKLLAELKSVSSDLSAAYSEFGRAAEPEMIDAAVFAINALDSEYGVLLRKIKNLTPEEAEPDTRKAGKPEKRDKSPIIFGAA